AAGRRVPLAVEHDAYFGDLEPVDLPPGGQAFVYLSTSNTCRAVNQPDQAAVAASRRSNSFTGIVITLPDGGSITATSVPLETSCGLRVSKLGIPPTTTTTTSPPPGSVASLRATVAFPPTVHPNTIVDYSVT